MKRASCWLKMVGTVSAIGCLVCIGARPAAAQTSIGLDLRLYAGLTVTGTVGIVYAIEYATGLDQANPTSSWRCLDFLQLPASSFVWADKSTAATTQRFYRARVFTAPTNFVFIPPGAFRMGSPTNEVDRDAVEGPQTAVTISRAFWMGKYEVTQGEYLQVMGTNPSAFTGDLSRPVEQVTWFDATNYCARLTQQERVAGRIASNSEFRLPTEAEWEYACRGWTSTRFSYGEDLGYTNLTKYGWFNGNSNSQTTHPVGQKSRNVWGLYDLHGNVWEWCQDWWSDNLPGGSVIDPQGPAEGVYRAFRGGSWFSDAAFCRSAYRFSILPSDRYSLIGFRAVLAPGAP